MRSQVQEMTRRALAGFCVLAVFAPGAAQASFLSGDALDTMANGLAWFVLIVMPLVAIGAFLYVHVLPELIAERRQHPHKDSIKVLCILSLFFGGLLWPFAWLWAFTKPMGYRMVYGTEKHEDHYLEMDAKARAGTLTATELEGLRHELAAMEAKGPLSPGMKQLAVDIDTNAIAARVVAQASEGSR
jgi:CBS domain containing-hemolysin-like protein